MQKQLREGGSGRASAKLGSFRGDNAGDAQLSGPSVSSSPKEWLSDESLNVDLRSEPLAPDTVLPSVSGHASFTDGGKLLFLRGVVEFKGSFSPSTTTEMNVFFSITMKLASDGYAGVFMEGDALSDIAPGRAALIWRIPAIRR